MKTRVDGLRRLIPWLNLVLVAGLGLTCGGGETQMGPGSSGGSSVASVSLQSAADTILAPARTSQLTATARDGSSNTVSTTFTWTTSNQAVAGVSNAGLVTANAVGNATISAAPQGSTVTGTIRLRVVAAEIPTVTTLSGDAFAAALIATVSANRRPSVQTAYERCGSGASAGNVVTVIRCVADVRTEAGAAANDPTDRVLLATLVFYVDQIERLLHL